MPTYEDIDGEEVRLSDAGRQDMDYEPCIRVEFEQGGYRCILHISSLGLLKAASFYSGDTLVRQVTVSELKTEAPEDVFDLPDGRSALERITENV